MAVNVVPPIPGLAPFVGDRKNDLMIPGAVGDRPRGRNKIDERESDSDIRYRQMNRNVARQPRECER